MRIFKQISLESQFATSSTRIDLIISKKVTSQSHNGISQFVNDLYNFIYIIFYSFLVLISSNNPQEPSFQH